MCSCHSLHPRAVLPLKENVVITKHRQLSLLETIQTPMQVRKLTLCNVRRKALKFNQNQMPFLNDLNLYNCYDLFIDLDPSITLSSLTQSKCFRTFLDCDRRSVTDVCIQISSVKSPPSENELKCIKIEEFQNLQKLKLHSSKFFVPVTVYGAANLSLFIDAPCIKITGDSTVHAIIHSDARLKLSKISVQNLETLVLSRISRLSIFDNGKQNNKEESNNSDDDGEENDNNVNNEEESDNSDNEEQQVVEEQDEEEEDNHGGENPNNDEQQEEEQQEEEEEQEEEQQEEEQQEEEQQEEEDNHGGENPNNDEQEEEEQQEEEDNHGGENPNNDEQEEEQQEEQNNEIIISNVNSLTPSLQQNQLILPLLGYLQVDHVQCNVVYSLLSFSFPNLATLSMLIIKEETRDEYSTKESLDFRNLPKLRILTVGWSCDFENSVYDPEPKHLVIKNNNSCRSIVARMPKQLFNEITIHNMPKLSDVNIVIGEEEDKKSTDYPKNMMEELFNEPCTDFTIHLTSLPSLSSLNYEDRHFSCCGVNFLLDQTIPKLTQNLCCFITSKYATDLEQFLRTTVRCELASTYISLECRLRESTISYLGKSVESVYNLFCPVFQTQVLQMLNSTKQTERQAFEAGKIIRKTIRWFKKIKNVSHKDVNLLHIPKSFLNEAKSCIKRYYEEIDEYFSNEDKSLIADIEQQQTSINFLTEFLFNHLEHLTTFFQNLEEYKRDISSKLEAFDHTPSNTISLLITRAIEARFLREMEEFKEIPSLGRKCIKESEELIQNIHLFLDPLKQRVKTFHYNAAKMILYSKQIETLQTFLQSIMIDSQTVSFFE